MRLGISSWTVPWSIGLPGYPAPPRPLTAIALIDLAERLGVNVVQIADNLPLHELALAELCHLREAADRRGIALQTGTRGVLPENLLPYLQISNELGAKVVRTVSHAIKGNPHITQVKQWIEQILPQFEHAGVAIVLENNEAHSVYEFAWLAREVNSPSLGICMDTANSLGALETTDRVTEVLAPYTTMLHVKDFDIRRIDTRMGFAVVGCPAGEGRVDFDWVFEQLSRYARDPVVILEHWPPFTETIEKTIQLEQDWVERSMRFLRART